MLDNSWVPWSGKQKSGGFSGAKAETFQIRSILGAENDEDRRHFEKFWEVPKNGTFWPKFGQNLGQHSPNIKNYGGYQQHTPGGDELCISTCPIQILFKSVK